MNWSAEASPALFPSPFMAGFECSSHRRRDGVRLDVIAASGHETYASADYRACRDLGLTAIRDGLRWHRVEPAPGRFDFGSWRPMLDAAAEAGVAIVWDLYHYGTPDFRDPLDEDFAAALAAFAAAAATEHRRSTGQPIRIVPANEISFLTWAIEHGYFPCAREPAPGELKRALARAAIAASKALRSVDPEALIYSSEPLIHVAAREPAEAAEAERLRLAQFEALDMILGDAAPELGGDPSLVDAIGLNFYPHNQWYAGGSTIPLGHHEYRPLADLLLEAAERHRKPLFVAETGAEGSARPAWLHYVAEEVRTANAAGAGIGAICLYPATPYPGWDNDRECRTGVLGGLSDGRRAVDEAVAAELERQMALGGLNRIASAPPARPAWPRRAARR